jgi:hypothetical protein
MLQMSPRLMVDETGKVIKLCKTTEIANSISEVKSSNRGKLPDNHQAHHVVPSNVVEKSALHQEAMKEDCTWRWVGLVTESFKKHDEDLLLEGASIDFTLEAIRIMIFKLGLIV